MRHGLHRSAAYVVLVLRREHEVLCALLQVGRDLRARSEQLLELCVPVNRLWFDGACGGVGMRRGRGRAA